ncbi:hypothetical protein [Amphritea sp. HPY]|uniref:hypothetical protein n=1 Tax=Amphritea sp. HPY TaxID=3421652 RepID=UPI003D7DBDA9
MSIHFKQGPLASVLHERKAGLYRPRCKPKNALLLSLVCLSLALPGMANACSLSFTSPASGSTTANASITVTGTGSGDAENGDYGSVTASNNGTVFFQQSGRFTSLVQFLQSGAASVSLKEGRNQLRLSGSVGGCSASDSMVIFYVPPANGDEKELGQQDCSAGNPISIASGNKYQLETIFSSVVPLALHYNSGTETWRHSYQSSFIVNNQNALLMRPDGQGLAFTLLNGQWQPGADTFFSVTDSGAGHSPRWQITSLQGITEHYDAQGRLQLLTSLSDETTSLTYSDRETTITSHLGDILQLTYANNGQLSNARLNGTITHSFNFDTDGRLLSRTDHDANTTRYHYENSSFANHLTGITGPDGNRFASWAYDNQGRGIMSEHDGQERVDLAFNDNGSTTVTNPLGKQTTYHFETIEGLKRPTQIQGHATANCTGANKAYTYYDNGLLHTKTDWNGVVSRYQYDMQRGLVTRIIEAEGTAQQQTTDQRWAVDKPQLLERQQGNQITRFSYNQNNQLVDTTQDFIR